MWRIWLDHHKVTLCERCWLRWSSSMPSMADQPFEIEPLTNTERDKILPQIVRPRKGQAEVEFYLEAVRAMEPGKLYRLKPGLGRSPVAVWYRLNRAARELEVQLHWPAGRPPGKQPASDPLYVELAASPRAERRNGLTREPALAARSAF
jgi:hypothetical protein